MNNGQLLKLQTCIDDNNARGLFNQPVCTFDSFIKHWNKIKYQGDVDQKCLEKFVPPTVYK